MISKLSISEHLNEEAHQPYEGTKVVSDHEAFICSRRVNIDEVNWPSINEWEGALHSVNEAEGLGVVATSASLLPVFTHFFVPVVFSRMSDADVDGEAESPDWNEALGKDHPGIYL